MKKLLFIPAVLIVLSLTSCKKDYTCTCTVTGGTNASVTTMVGVSKAAANANCVSTTRTDSSGDTEITTCELSK